MPVSHRGRALRLFSQKLETVLSGQRKEDIAMLTSKQRAYLRSLANSEAPILHAGKGGVSDTMRRQADDALTARELIKGRALENTRPYPPGKWPRIMAASVGADVVQVVGRTFVLYRPNPNEPKDPPSPLESRRCPVKGGRGRTMPAS